MYVSLSDMKIEISLRLIISSIFWPVWLCRLLRNCPPNSRIFGKRRIWHEHFLIFCTTCIRKIFLHPKNSPIGAGVFHAERRTDMTMLIVSFRNFGNEPKMISVLIIWLLRVKYNNILVLYILHSHDQSTFCCNFDNDHVSVCEIQHKSENIRNQLHVNCRYKALCQLVCAFA
jgi:hypothetical protein